MLTDGVLTKLLQLDIVLKLYTYIHAHHSDIQVYHPDMHRHVTHPDCMHVCMCMHDCLPVDARSHIGMRASANVYMCVCFYVCVCL